MTSADRTSSLRTEFQGGKSSLVRTYPENPKPRIQLVDALRGFALAGVGLVHFLEGFAGGLLAPGAAEAADHGLIDLAFRGLLWMSFGKFFALFSILFGVSFTLMRRSGGDAPGFRRRFLWRSVILAGIGLVHQLFYRGDILLVYASLSPLLLLVHRLPTRWLAGIIAVCFLGLPRLLAFAIGGEGPAFGPAPVLDPTHPYAAAYTGLLQNGSFTALAREHLTGGLGLKADLYLGILGRYYYTFGYFLVGLLLGRAGMLGDSHRLLRYRRPLKRYALGLLTVGTLLMLALFSQVGQPIDWSGWLPVVALNFYDWTNVAVTALILLGFVSAYQSGAGRRVLALFAPYGRMALTNYVGLSLIGTFLLFDWGLGGFGAVRTHQLALLAAWVVAAQMAGSAWWLTRFRYGPLEWIWRSFTYRKIQPLRLPVAVPTYVRS
ncbi:uncharacterized protein CLV84_0178 [Neolewinella xylanilytica]|uniref:DUF418 domain-containing protein n=1 Tax=Neolewinella xylanilytica TaxID=1514080 RepID=A0A2S6I6X7_9BACT|nr:DUF418 domain-containing protein [Neolewinella xylanilytica]PPK87241.1 uncharacterized protein CLV84_0178 [Neolewinella xylanilytica]